MSYRSKILPSKVPKEERELRIITNPRFSGQDDYHAPSTALTLAPNSKWIIVRNNLHTIRLWGKSQKLNLKDPFGDIYAFCQMRQELRSVQKQIQRVEARPDFTPIHYFYLSTDERHTERYDVGHIQPSEALFYPGFGLEPFVLQSLFYYFSIESPIRHNSVFQPFLSHVCAVVNRNERYLHRVAVLRKLAAIIASIVYIILGLMFFTLIFSVLKTTSSFHRFYANNPHGDLDWRPFEADVNSYG
jgi:hypothetical protein